MFHWAKVFQIKFGLALIAAILIYLLPASLSAKSDLPPKWPWKGVSISYPGGTIDDLFRMKHSLNINMVRLHVRVNQYAKVNQVSGQLALESSIEWLDEMLDAASELGITSIISYSQFPLADQNGNAIIEMSSPDFWSSPENIDEVLSITRRLVKHFKVRGSELAAYQIISEPYVIIDGNSKSPSQWPALLASIVDLTNKADPQRWVLVTPGPGGDPRGYEDYKHLQSNRVIYNAHFYLPHAFTHQGINGRPLGKSYPGFVGLKYWNKCELQDSLIYLRSFQKKNNVPVFIGEFSAVRWAAGSEEYIKDLVTIFDGYEWGWAYFSGTGWHGWNPDYNTYYPGPDAGAWNNNFVGEQSVRWQTLREIFGVEQGNNH